MSFFSFKGRPKNPQSSVDDPDILEPLRGQRINDHQNAVDGDEDDGDDASSSSLLPPGVKLINPSLQPEKARTFAGDRLPQTFEVRFLGVCPASGIWGIKHTRKVVDELVEAAKAVDSDDLTSLDMEISVRGAFLRQISPERLGDSAREIQLGLKPIERITYGAQDVIYPRIFAMIAIKDKFLIDNTPFDCFVFLCDNRIQARKLAYCLAKAFKHYGEGVKAANFMQTFRDTDSDGAPIYMNAGPGSRVSSETSKTSTTDSSDA